MQTLFFFFFFPVDCFNPFIRSAVVFHFSCNIKHPVTTSLQSPAQRKTIQYLTPINRHGQSEPEVVTGESTENCNWGGKREKSGQQRVQESGGEGAHLAQGKP